MISRHIACAAKNDNYRRLANYIAAFGRDPEPATAECQSTEAESLLHWSSNAPNEKCLMKWTAGCWAGDNYELAIQEIADTQALNTRTTKEKTYHLIVSFRPEDQTRLTPDTFKSIERRFAEALGLSDNQRHCGVHINTKNIHMHVAYNLIHPETLTRVEPFKDFIKRDRLCRQLEREYGLTIDNGRAPERQSQISDHAAAKEAHSGEQSFESFAHDQGEAILEELESAKTWEDVHKIFARHGLELATRGAGLVAKDRHGKQRVKASAIHRELSLKKLKSRFGIFQRPMVQLPESEVRYGAKPIQKNADRNHLWHEYQAIQQSHREELEAVKEKWRKYREELEKQGIGRRSKARLMQLSRQKEAQEKHNLQMQSPGSWLEWLQAQAKNGDENALAILRSRKEEVLPEPESEQETMISRAEYLAQKTVILENNYIGYKSKKRLTKQFLMESLAPEAKTEISSYGHLIYTLPNKEVICDTGKSISFSDGAREQALAYMSASWNIRRMERDKDGQAIFVLPDGQKIQDNGNRIFERPKPLNGRSKSQEIGR